VAVELRQHGVIVDETRTADVAVSLNERGNIENRQSYDYFISFHCNAFKPEQAKGVETYTYLNPGAKAKGLAEKIQTALVNIGFTNRGVKAANFHVLRETKAPAVLVEVEFIGNTEDNQLFDNKRDEIVVAIAGAILEQLGIKYLPSSPPPPFSPAPDPKSYAPTKVASITTAFEVEDIDPRMVARQEGFTDHREKAEYIENKGLRVEHP
jgi:N-acetylmuramoyl-L-alanine amidase